MKFTKSNINFAAKHGIDLNINYDEGHVLFFLKGEDENFLEYTLDSEKDQLFFKFQVYGEKIEDLPQWITTSKQLNGVIKYVKEVFRA